MWHGIAPVKASLKLDEDFNRVTSSVSAREEFERKFRDDTARILKCSPDRITILSLSKGSVVVNMQIEPASSVDGKTSEEMPSPMALAQRLREEKGDACVVAAPPSISSIIADNTRLTQEVVRLEKDRQLLVSELEAAKVTINDKDVALVSSQKRVTQVEELLANEQKVAADKAVSTNDQQATAVATLETRAVDAEKKAIAFETELIEVVTHVLSICSFFDQPCSYAHVLACVIQRKQLSLAEQSVHEIEAAKFKIESDKRTTDAVFT
jgi:hypothetical protein